MRTWAQISSLRPLIKHLERKHQSCPLFENPGAQMHLLSLLLCLIASVLSNGPNGWCQCQSVHKAQSNWSKHYTLDGKFFFIATIAVLDQMENTIPKFIKLSHKLGPSNIPLMGSFSPLPPLPAFLI
jgi:hypothetical protein